MGDYFLRHWSSSVILYNPVQKSSKQKYLLNIKNEKQAFPNENILVS